jgi:hypothetical protein
VQGLGLIPEPVRGMFETSQVLLSLLQLPFSFILKLVVHRVEVNPPEQIV